MFIFEKSELNDNQGIRNQELQNENDRHDDTRHITDGEGDHCDFCATEADSWTIREFSAKANDILRRELGGRAQFFSTRPIRA